MRLGSALEQNLDLLLRGLQRGLAVPRERDAALEQFQGFLERKVAALEALDEGLKLGQGLLEIRRFVGTDQDPRGS